MPRSRRERKGFGEFFHFSWGSAKKRGKSLALRGKIHQSAGRAGRKNGRKRAGRGRAGRQLRRYLMQTRMPSTISTIPRMLDTMESARIMSLTSFLEDWNEWDLSYLTLIIMQGIFLSRQKFFHKKCIDMVMVERRVGHLGKRKWGRGPQRDHGPYHTGI